jgi:PhzF family phenazine biosynthesis protein
MDGRACLQVIDAFTDQPFQGNPAAVCVLAGPGEELWMQMVAREMNLSETAFLYPLTAAAGLGEGWSLRWFTPQVEVALCGHATLAAAHVLWEMGKLTLHQEARFLTESGWLTCRRVGKSIEMDFPASPIAPAPEQRAAVEAILGCQVLEVWSTPFDLLAEIASDRGLELLEPDLTQLGKLPIRGLIVTAQSDGAPYDFLSRFFAPSCGVPEDPVTGSAHCALGPYWQRKLTKPSFQAFQASSRGGQVGISLQGDRVLLRGQAVAVSRVELKTAPFPPALQMSLGGGLTLRQPELEDAEELYATVDKNRAYLRQWLPWLEYNTEAAHSAEFIATSRQQAAQGVTLNLLICQEGEIAGIVGFNLINQVNKSGQIGYWLAEGHQGRGIMHRSVRAIMQYGFQELGLNSLMIAAAMENAKSRAVARQLGFHELGIDPQAEWLYDHYVDHVRHVMTAEQWRRVHLPKIT